MDATTEIPPQTPHAGQPGPVDNDPVHDIDAKKTVTWLVFWVVLLGGGLWLLLQLFSYVVFQERHQKIELRQNTEAQQILERENVILEGRVDGQGMTIEQAMERIAAGQRPGGH